ncbi:hypothetical protein PHAVU_010G104400 [Phaseolus vulgaris]|uniref:Uncharacterized protein n=1 Tax=Phaseolus vulgaris TaxID=3885 RepID=V7APB7_PHAVU|nr:hypothetical protein PHAVU_010G104400g [Phaseolus vulgaris]ESW07135.1 hypothetical protein PHAVU_010G104400g [Phaseolus vulgaris]
MVSKSKNEIIFVEIDGDFVDFLSTFLTTPLGSIMNLKNDKLSYCLIPLAYILKLKNDKLSLGSIRNLYKSVKNLDLSWFTKSSNKFLLNPKVASHFSCERNPLLIASQDETGKYWYGLREEKNEKGRIIFERKMISRKHDMLKEPKDIKLLDPRSLNGARKGGVGFINRSCLFVVSDDLELSQMTNISSTSCKFMDNHPFTDLEEHLVKIKKSKALNLLRASLTSDKGAFTRGLSFLLWKWRFQRLFPCSGFLRRKKNKKGRKKKKKKKLPEREKEKR